MNTIKNRSISDRLFRFFTNELVMSAAITLSTVFVFLSGYKLKSNIFLYLDGFFTIFFFIEALVKITCSNPGLGKTSLREKFRYYWFGKFDIEKQKEFSGILKGFDAKTVTIQDGEDERDCQKQADDAPGPAGSGFHRADLLVGGMAPLPKGGCQPQG